jgi:predicted  nucleic acid-binding Zn-ribbon protein
MSLEKNNAEKHSSKQKDRFQLDELQKKMDAVKMKLEQLEYKINELMSSDIK